MTLGQSFDRFINAAIVAGGEFMREFSTVVDSVLEDFWPMKAGERAKFAESLNAAEESRECWEPDELYAAMQRHPAGKGRHRREDAERTSGEYEAGSDEPIPYVLTSLCNCTPPDDDYDNPIGEVPCVTREDLDCCSKVSAAGVRHQFSGAPVRVSASEPGHSSSPAGVGSPLVDTSRHSTSDDLISAAALIRLYAGMDEFYLFELCDRLESYATQFSQAK